MGEVVSDRTADGVFVRGESLTNTTKIMSSYTFNGTNSNDEINTSDLQSQFTWVTSGFRVNGLDGDDNIISSFIGRNGVDGINGGEGNDFMSVFPSYLTPLPITNYVGFFGDFGTDIVFLPTGSHSVSDFSINEFDQIEFTVFGNGGEVTEVSVSPTVEVITLGDLNYLTEDIWNGRIRAVDFDELYARSYNENSDWAIFGLDTYSDYHSGATPGPVDSNRDGFVDEVTNYQMWTASGGVDLTNRRGRTYSDSSSRKWDAIKAVENDTGFSILVEGQLNIDGKFKVVSANEQGVIGGATRWLDGDQMLVSGYEEIFSMDFNGNGVLDLV